MKVKVEAIDSDKVNVYDNVRMIDTDLDNNICIYYTNAIGLEKEATYPLSKYKKNITIEA